MLRVFVLVAALAAAASAITIHGQTGEQLQSDGSGSLRVVSLDNTQLATELTLGSVDTSLTSLLTTTAADGATAPALTTVVAGKDGSGNTQALATETSGALHVTDASGGALATEATLGSVDTSLTSLLTTTAADGATAPALTTVVAGKDGSGNTQAISTDASGNVNVVFGQALDIMFDDADLTTPNAFSAIDLDVSGAKSCVIVSVCSAYDRTTDPIIELWESFLEGTPTDADYMAVDATNAKHTFTDGSLARSGVFTVMGRWATLKVTTAASGGTTSSCDVSLSCK